MIAIIAAAMLIQAAPQEDPGFTDLWNKYGSAMEAQGMVTNPSRQPIVSGSPIVGSPT